MDNWNNSTKVGQINSSRYVRASEINRFVFCRRAWWYQAQGYVPSNQRNLNEGSAYHQDVGRRIVLNRLLKLAGIILLIAAGLILMYAVLCGKGVI